MQILNKNFVVYQIPTPCLSQFTYYIESNGEAVVIDPLRDVSPYVELVKARNAKIKYVIETHFHADYVAGHVALSKSAGASIVLGPNKSAKFDHMQVNDGDLLEVGNIKLKMLHTPGHTLESICVLLINSNERDKQEAVFTGDTLFIGDVGRPDLAVKDDLITIKDLSNHLFDSINKLKQLDDNCKVLPSHGAGSPCGKNLSSKTYCTIGKQKKDNYALKINNPEEFYTEITSNISEAPSYFKYNVSLNLNNEAVQETTDILNMSKRAVTVEELKGLMLDDDYIVLDTRETQAFEKSHIPRSINVPLGGQFAIWAASVINPNKRLVIICNHDKLDETIIRLARTGLHNIHGYLEGGFENWENSNNPKGAVLSFEAEDVFRHLRDHKDSVVLDVRNKTELEKGIAENSKLLNLNLVNGNVEELVPKNIEHFIVCGGGIRSVIAYSVLKRNGHNVKNIRGGFGSLVRAGFNIVKPLIK